MNPLPRVRNLSERETENVRDRAPVRLATGIRG